MEHEAQIDTLRAAIVEVLSMTSKVVAELSEPDNLRLMVLKGITQAAHDHASAILRLSEEEQTRSANVLLRTLMEGWITARYVLPDDTGERARAYVMKELTETLRLLEKLRGLVDKNPCEEHAILASAGLSTLNDLDRRITKQRGYIQPLKERGLRSFPNVADCAKALGLDVELAYANVYGFLLSQQVHARPRDTLRSLLNHAGDGDDLYEILLTTLYLLVQMLGMTSQHFGRPERKSLVRFETLLQDLQSPQP